MFSYSIRWGKSENEKKNEKKKDTGSFELGAHYINLI